MANCPIDNTVLTAVDSSTIWTGYSCATCNGSFVESGNQLLATWPLIRYTSTAGGITIPGNVSVSGSVTGTGAYLPATSDGAALGSATKMWSDLFLASGGVINFDNGDVTITHAANALSFAGGVYNFDGVVATTDATASTSTTTGSLKAAGGLGVVGAAFFGGLVTSNSVAGFRSLPVFVPDATRTNYGFAIGTRATELDVTMAAALTQHLDPIQMNLNIIGANPTGSSTVNGIYQLITHDTADMANLRLKNADWNVVVAKDVLDAYCYQGEIDFTAAGITVGGESAVMGLVMNAGTDAVTGSLRGLIVSLQGAGNSTDVIGMEIRCNVGTALGNGAKEAIKLFGTPLPIVGISMGDQANDNQGPQFAFFFPTGGGVFGADIGPLVNTVMAGDGEGSIAIKVGAGTKYLKYWASAS